MTLLVRIVMFLLHIHVPHLETYQAEIEPFTRNETEKKNKKKKKKINKNPNRRQRKQCGIRDPNIILALIFNFEGSTVRPPEYKSKKIKAHEEWYIWSF